MPSIADALGELNDKAMTRKEQIKEYLRIIGNGETMGIPFDAGFECCVEWADSHPSWISVKDRKPKIKHSADNMKYSDTVIVTNGKYRISARWVHNTWAGWYGWYDDGDEELKGITHWMPLPSIEHFADVSKKISSSEKPNNCKKGGEQ